MDIQVRRVDFGYFVRPGSETVDGAARVEPVLGCLIDHPDGVLLVDSGMGTHPWVEDHYRPTRVALPEAVARAGSTIDDIRYVTNCHLHFDHCGGNPSLPGRPVFTQATELEVARNVTGHTLPELVDPPGLKHVELDGEAEVLPGVHVIPTPGHTAGHQSVVVRQNDGSIIVAGQSHDNASLFTYDVLGVRAGEGTPPPWLSRLLEFDPRRIVFAHDNAEWTPA
ncbi:MBL fold metallo-hydrolase [Actinoplanes sp. NPDC049265]|uniref:MBL fold metallo-hydrolase n=1 Tax=Actinoplanes sp. NPDC049265 TaxID=3363902 RepID=UPI0037218D07